MVNVGNTTIVRVNHCFSKVALDTNHAAHATNYFRCGTRPHTLDSHNSRSLVTNIHSNVCLHNVAVTTHI